NNQPRRKGVAYEARYAGSGWPVSSAAIERCRKQARPDGAKTAAIEDVIFSRGNVSVARHFFFQAEDGIRDRNVTGVQTCALPILFNLGAACVALGLCRAAVAGTTAHLKSARFEHLGQSLGESLPTLRAQLASMQIDTDGLSARIDDLIEHLESPREATMLRVLESKAAAGDVAIGVTSTAMRICGGAAFSKHMSIERLFRDAHAGAVMAPTGDVLREFIGKALLGMPLF